ncbi:hypothetical protein AURANDRAFT_16528, partial [Aureococcus anophagefferens]
LRQIFKRFDANGDGSLSRDELRLALEGRNRDVTRFEDFWAALDRDHDGRKLRKAINVACHGAGAGASLGLLRSIFRRFDASGDGVIQRDELRKGLSIAGVDFSQGAYDEVMAEMDIDHDGAVSLPEFAHAICG